MVNHLETAASLDSKSSSKSILFLAGDLGKSACKFLYWIEDRDFQPLWLGSDVAIGVEEVVLDKFKLAADLGESAWMRADNQNILVGSSAATYSSSFAANKVQTAAYQITTALGLAAIESSLSEYQALISVAIPLNEFRHCSEIATQLQTIGKGFVVCGREQRFEVTPWFYPEGTGLYLMHKQRGTGGASQARRVIVLMMGHRNLSMLVFENGKLNMNLSQTSDRLGFWSGFRDDATNAGIREREFGSLLTAIYTGKPQQLSAVAGGIKDFSAPMNVVRQGEVQRLEAFCRDNVVDLLADGMPTDILMGGGVAHVMRSELRSYFNGFGITDHLFFADANSSQLLLFAEQSRNAQADLARPMRFADVYGLAQALVGKAKLQ